MSRWAIVLVMIAALVIGVALVVPFALAVLTLAPLAVAAVPALWLIWRARRRRMAFEGRDLDEIRYDPNDPDYWYRKATQGRRIVDDRVA